MDEGEFRDLEDQFEAEPRRESVGEGVPWGGVLLLFWAVLLIVFSVQNAGDADVKFLGWEWQMPVALLVMVTSLVTIILTSAGSAIYRRRRRARREMREERRSAG